MKQAWLEYFQSLLEGTADVSWNAWFAQNEASLKAELPRAAFLRLKFNKLDEAEKYLRQAGINYRVDPAAARRERYYAMLHPSVLDSSGRPRQDFLRNAYDGARGRLMDGDIDGARATLATFIRKTRRLQVQRRQEVLESLCFDGEMELQCGSRDIAQAYLAAVASVPEGNDLTDPAIRRAKELLANLDARLPE